MRYKYKAPIFTVLLSIALVIFSLILPSAYAEEPQESYIEPTTGMQFVWIPGGTFLMGDPSDKDRWATPAHEVTVEPFYMGKFEVTFDQYDRFCSKTGRLLPSDAGWGRGLRPVINVSWQDAVDFAEWLSEETGQTFRLPSEAEWEYAARAGSTTLFPWGDALGRANANCKGCGSNWDNRSTASIGSFTPNRFGLYDMAGNVYEWCLDSFHSNYGDAPTDGSAWLKGKHTDTRMNRGGSWMENPYEVRSYARCWDPADFKKSELGFRLVLEP